MFRFITIVLLLLSCMQAGAQSTVFNQTDEKGRPQGQWVNKYPARMGEDAYAEWGSYDHGVKWGAWYKFDGDAQVTAIEHYRAGVLDGEAKYFEQGALTVIGHYRGLNPEYKYDTIYVTDPTTDTEVRRIVSTERGTLKHGTWRFYDPRTGRLVRELEYQLDEVVASQEFAVAPVDSAWYKRREAAMPHNQKHYYKPPRDKEIHYTDFRE
jgi:hypothetical protein